MHELSLAHDLVEIASNAARNAHIARVSAVHLNLGPLAGVVPEALQFGYEVAAQGTPLEGSRLVIHAVPLIVKCAECDAGCPAEAYPVLACERRGLPAPLLVSGRELQIESLEYDD